MCSTCGCSNVVPGALWPWAPLGDDSLPFVEACDDCRAFDCDDDAAQAIAEHVGGRVMWTRAEGDDPAARRPFVLPTLVSTDPTFPITPQQAVALGKSTYVGEHAGTVQLTLRAGGRLDVTQADGYFTLDRSGDEV